jgi:hypothetical protein
MCNDKTIKELLPRFRKLALDRDDEKRVQAHLAACNDCRTELFLLRLMPDEAPPDPGKAFWNAMPGRVYRAVQEQPTRKNLYDLFGHWKRFVLSARTYAAAAAAGVLVLSWILISPGRLQNHASSAAEYAYHEYAGNPDLLIHELSPAQLQSVDVWAARELSRIASEAASAGQAGYDRDLTEDLVELNSHEMERLSALLKNYGKEGSS